MMSVTINRLVSIRRYTHSINITICDDVIYAIASKVCKTHGYKLSPFKQLISAQF